MKSMCTNFTQPKQPLRRRGSGRIDVHASQANARSKNGKLPFASPDDGAVQASRQVYIGMRCSGPINFKLRRSKVLMMTTTRVHNPHTSLSRAIYDQ